MLGACTIRRLGFAVRWPMRTFARQFAVVANRPSAAADATDASVRALCEAILHAAAAGASDARIGRTLVFARDSFEIALQRQWRRAVGASVVRMQACARAFFARRAFSARVRAMRRIGALLSEPTPTGWRFVEELSAALADADAQRICLPRVTAAAALLRRCASAVRIQCAARRSRALRRVGSRRRVAGAIEAALAGARADVRALAAALAEARSVGMDVRLVRHASGVLVRAALLTTT